MSDQRGATSLLGSSRATEPLLAVDGLTVQFVTDRGWVTVVDGVSFTLDPGETLGLVGESGSGKSVTALSIAGLIPRPSGRISGGSILFEGTDLVALDDRRYDEIRGEELAMIFQEPMTSLNPAYTVGDQIAESVRRHRRGSRKQAWARAVEVLDLVGIPNAARRSRSYPHEFSGGMRQRAMIAMALACEPKMVIADEPTTALDVTIQAQVLDLMRRMRDEFSMAILFITHDLGVVADLCDRVVVMYAGQVVETADVDDLYRQPEHPYTEGLLTAMPQVDTRSGRLAVIPGTTPAPWAMPEGCRFHPRCPYSEAKCTEGPIPLLDVGAGRHSRCVRVDELTLRGAE